MTQVSASQVKELREQTGAGMMDCKNALKEAQGDFKKAIEALRKKGIASAAKKMGRTASEGSIASYIHGEGRLGVLVEVNCETDFVARTEVFQRFVKEIGLQIAASKPRWIKSDEITPEVMMHEKDIIKAQVKAMGKVSEGAAFDELTEAQWKQYVSQSCLMEQPFVKDSHKNVKQLLQETIAAVGENISIKRFALFSLGEHSKN